MSEITPDEITLSGSVKYESAQEVLDILSELKELDSLDQYNNQVVDLEAEEPVMAFSSKADEEQTNSINFQSVPSPDQLPEEPPDIGEDIDSDELELNTLAISANFLYADLDLLDSTIEAVLRVVESIELQMFYFSLTLEESFDDLATISRLDESTEFDLNGIQFEHKSHQYSFGEVEEGTEVYAIYGGEEKIDNESYGSFIDTQLETIAPIIKQICYDE